MYFRNLEFLPVADHSLSRGDAGISDGVCGDGEAVTAADG